MTKRIPFEKEKVINSFLMLSVYTMIIGSVFSRMLYAAALLVFLAIPVWMTMHRAEMSGKIKGQFAVIEVSVAILMLGVVVNSDNASLMARLLAAYIAVVMVVCAGLLLLERFRNISGFFKRNIFLMVLVAVFICTLVPIIGVYHVWDSDFYVRAMCEAADVFDMGITRSFYDLYLCGHASSGFTLVYMPGALFDTNGTVGIMVVQIIALAVSAFAFYGVVCKIAPALDRTGRVLVTGVFVFSPFVCGMAADISLDTGMIVLFMIFLFCYYRDYYLLCSIAALFFVFTKEPAIVAYAGFLFGEFLFEAVAQVKKKESNLRRVLLLGAPPVLWLVLYVLHGAWESPDGATNQFFLEKTYTIQKLLQFFVLNFNWLIWTAIAVLVIYGLCRKMLGMEQIRYAVPILLSFMAYFLFNVAFHTNIHARYISFVCVVSSLLFAIFCGAANREGITGMLATKVLPLVMGVLFLVQSFVLLDPLTKATFPKYNVGKGEIITMFVGYPTDALFYNREYLDYFRAIENALRDGDYDEETIVVISTANTSKYSIEGNGDCLCWNSEKKRFIRGTDSYRVQVYELEELRNNLQDLHGKKAICLVSPMGNKNGVTDGFSRLVDIEQSYASESGKWVFEAYSGIVK